MFLPIFLFFCFLTACSTEQFTVNTDKTRFLPKKIDISELNPGQYLMEIWGGIPVFVYRRTAEDINSLIKYDYPVNNKQFSSNLPERFSWLTSVIEQDADWVMSAYRSLNKEYFVFIALSPISGCSVHLKLPDHHWTYEKNPPDNWQGGFFDPCQHIYFDFAGQIYPNDHSGIKFLVPHHQYVNDNIIRLYTKTLSSRK